MVSTTSTGPVGRFDDNLETGWHKSAHVNFLAEQQFHAQQVVPCRPEPVRPRACQSYVDKLDGTPCGALTSPLLGLPGVVGLTGVPLDRRALRAYRRVREGLRVLEMRGCRHARLWHPAAEGGGRDHQADAADHPDEISVLFARRVFGEDGITNSEHDEHRTEHEIDDPTGHGAAA
jgi:hypothetical protein